MKPSQIGLETVPPTDAASYSLDAALAVIWPATQHFVADDVLAAIAEEAAAADERGALSDASLDRLRGAGYFGLAVPVQLSGRGAGLLECAAVQRRLAMADPALAIAVNMHLFSVGMATEHWRRRRESCGLILEAIAVQRRIIASAFAEPGLGAALLRSTMKARRAGGKKGYVVSGVKSPCSLAAYCDLVCFQMQAEASEPDGLMMAMLPARTPGIRVERTWDALGMRGSASDTLIFEDCFVPDELVFSRSGPGFADDEVFAAGLVWFCVTTTATYLGIVKAAIDQACEVLRRASLPDSGTARALSPTIQGELGELVARTLVIDTACSGAAARMDAGGGDPRSLLASAVATKHMAVDACIQVVEALGELSGGRSYGRASRAARLLRDVQAARFHPPTRLVSRQLLGRWALNLPFAYELDERAAPRA